MKRARENVVAELEAVQQQFRADDPEAQSRLRSLVSTSHPLLQRWSHALLTAAEAMVPALISLEQEHEEDQQRETTGLFFPVARLVKGTLEQLSGLEGPKQALLESMVFPRLYPGCFRRGFTPFKRILLFGPPGTGKSSLVRAAVARAFQEDARARFAELSASDVLSSLFGDSEQRVRAVFAEACVHGMQRGPVVIYLDEIDSLARTKHTGEDDTTRRIKNELLRGLEALEEAPNVWCVASTNTPWELDRAVVRRFERRLLVPLPGAAERAALLAHALGEEAEPALSLAEAVRRSEGYSGADLQTVCRFASMVGVRELLRRAPAMTHGERRTARPRPVVEDDLLEALRTINRSVDAATVTQHDAWAASFGEA